MGSKVLLSEWNEKAQQLDREGKTTNWISLFLFFAFFYGFVAGQTYLVATLVCLTSHFTAYPANPFGDVVLTELVKLAK